MKSNQGMASDIFADAFTLLDHPHSPKRRSGAKRLRRLRDPRACQPLLDALKRELRDPRTWETQYQIIMALSECGCRDSLGYLRELAGVRFDATMISMALGHAIVQLGRGYDNDPAPVLDCMSSYNLSVVIGAYRAVAVLRLKLTDDATRTIIAFVSGMSVNDGTEVWFALDGLRFWIAAAAAGWRGPHVEAFLQSCVVGSRQHITSVASASLDHRYLELPPGL